MEKICFSKGVTISKVMNEMQKCKHESSGWNRAFVELEAERGGGKK